MAGADGDLVAFAERRIGPVLVSFGQGVTAVRETLTHDTELTGGNRVTTGMDRGERLAVLLPPDYRLRGRLRARRNRQPQGTADRDRRHEGDHNQHADRDTRGNTRIVVRWRHAS
jgi:hypothetical protein